MTSPYISGRRGRDDRADREKWIYVLEEIQDSRVRAALLGQHGSLPLATRTDYVTKNEDGLFQL